MSNIFNDHFLVFTITNFLPHDDFAVVHQVNKVTNNVYCDFLYDFRAVLVHRKNHGALLARYPCPEERLMSAIDGRTVYETGNVYGYVDGIVLDCGINIRVMHEHRLFTIRNDRFSLKAIDDGQTYPTTSIWSLIMTTQNGGWAARRGNSLYFSNVAGIVYELPLVNPIDLDKNLIVDAHSDDYDDMSVSSERSITGYEPLDKRSRCY